MPVEATARLRFVSIPARKMRRVATLVKGLPVEKAINMMNFTPKVAAGHIAQTLKSAAANALSVKGTSAFHPESLVVQEIRVDDGPSAKRIRYQSMGRVFRYKKRYCHLTVRLVEDLKINAKLAPKAVEKKGVRAADKSAKVAGTGDAKKTKKARSAETGASE